MTKGQLGLRKAKDREQAMAAYDPERTFPPTSGAPNGPKGEFQRCQCGPEP